MPRQPSVKTKIKRGMGRGTMENYKPFIETTEFNSLGTASIITDWKTGRGVHCLSQGEADWYYVLRWNDNNIDIREQYPLADENYSLEETIQIAKKLGVRPPRKDGPPMTTDFLVTRPGGKMIAYSVKATRDIKKREREHLDIEKEYWRRRDVPFVELYRSEVNSILVDNIRIVCSYYDKSRVFDHYSRIRHKIAVKEYVADMETKFLDCEELDRIEAENIRRLKDA